MLALSGSGVGEEGSVWEGEGCVFSLAKMFLKVKMNRLEQFVTILSVA